MKKLKVVAVSYLNTKPLLYGILQSAIQHKIELSLEIPSVCAAKLKSGEADMGLVPVAIIPELETPHIISEYCIGAVGKVATVCIFSNCPIEQIRRLYLDEDSRTSVALTKLLLKKYWKLAPTLILSSDIPFDRLDQHSAALAIGDKTMGLHAQFPYVYDLGEEWMRFTGLPFVFAAWVSNIELPPAFVKPFNKALEAGIAHIPQLTYLLPTPAAGFDLKEYFTHCISYQLDEAKKAGLELFLESISPKLELAYS